jgi:formylglycine-generating enzyme required for sulfatase activity
MVGNIWQWTADCAHSNYNGAPSDGSPWIAGGDCTRRMNRGGSWGLAPENLSSAYRAESTIGDRDYYLGFRVARTLP